MKISITTDDGTVLDILIGKTYEMTDAQLVQSVKADPVQAKKMICGFADVVREAVVDEALKLGKRG